MDFRTVNFVSAIEALIVFELCLFVASTSNIRTLKLFFTPLGNNFESSSVLSMNHTSATE